MAYVLNKQLPVMAANEGYGGAGEERGNGFVSDSSTQSAGLSGSTAVSIYLLPVVHRKI